MNRDLLREYSTFKSKFNNATSTEKKAHPWWTAVSSFASSFIPFGLGAVITPAANAGVQKGKATGTNKLNDYRRRLGLPEEADTSGSGLDLSGVGWAAGKGVQSAISGATGGEMQGGGGDFIPIKMTGDNQQYTPAVDMPTGGGTTGLELPKTDYWNNSGGGASGMFATTQNGYTIAPATMRDGGKIDGPMHEQGGVDVIDATTGKHTGIKVEGGERVVNDKDWQDVISFLKAGKGKKALTLLKDIDSREPEQGEFAEGGKFDWNQAVDYGFDGARLGLGISEAMKPLPQYNLPPDWSKYMDKARYFSEQGLLPEERAMAKQMYDSDYAAQVRDIANYSGGNAGAVLGNLSNANMGRYNVANQLALADRQVQQQNFDKYGNLLLNDIALNKDVFDRKFNQAVTNKETGAGLASDAIYDIRSRMDYNKLYGDGSAYAKLQQAMVDKGMSEAEISKAMAEHYKDPNFIKGLYYTNPTSTGGLYPLPKNTPAATTTTTPTQNYNNTIPSKHVEDAVMKAVGNLNEKNLTKKQWFDVIEQLREDESGNKRLTSDIYSELEKAGYVQPKGLY